MATVSPPDSSRALWALSLRQHGVVARDQLRAYGLGEEAIRHRLRTGRLHRMVRGVYAVGRPEVSREGWWLAATLACGPTALLSHHSAATLWRIREATPRLVDVSLPDRRDRRHPGIRVHRVRLGQDERRIRRGVPVVDPARTLLNLAASSSRRRLEADVNAADALGLITPGRLGREARRFTGQPGVAALRALIEEHTFTLTRSELERMFLPVARSVGLDPPRTQARVNGFTVDFLWPGLGLVVETDGLRYHRTPGQQAHDLYRDQTHKAAGLEPLRFTHWQVAHDQPWVRSTLQLVAARLRRS